MINPLLYILGKHMLRKKIVNTPNESPIYAPKKSGLSSFERWEICKKHRVSSDIIQGSFGRYRGNINVLEHPLLSEDNFKIIYELSHAFAQIFSETNFYNKALNYNGHDLEQLIPAYGNPNISMALYTHDQKQCLKLVVSGSKPDKSDPYSSKTKMEKLIAGINSKDTTNEYHIALKELLRVHNIHELSIVTHHSEITDEIIQDHWDNVNKNPALGPYGCSEGTMYRELLKVVRDDKAIVLGSGHFSLIMELGTSKTKLQIYDFFSQSSCSTRCQLMHAANKFRLDQLGLNVSSSDIVKEQHGVSKYAKRSKKIMPLPLPHHPDELLFEINKIENEDERLVLLEKYSTDYPNIAQAFEQLITKQISAMYGNDEYIELLKIVNGHPNIKHIITHFCIDESLAKKIIINRVLQLAIEKNDTLSLSQLQNCNNIASIFACLCEKNIEQIGLGAIINLEFDANHPLLHQYISQSVEKNLVSIFINANEFTIPQLYAIFNENWAEFIKLSLDEKDCEFVNHYIKNVNLAPIHPVATKKLKDLISVHFKECMDSISKLKVCQQAANKNKLAIAKLMNLLMNKLPNELKELIKLANIDINSYIQVLASKFEPSEAINKNSYIYCEYLEKIQSSFLGAHCINENTRKFFDIIRKQNDLENEEEDIIYQKKIIITLNDNIKETRNLLTSSQKKHETLNKSLKDSVKSQSSSEIITINLNEKHNAGTNGQKSSKKNKNTPNQQPIKKDKAAEKLAQQKQKDLIRQSNEVKIQSDKYRIQLHNEKTKLEDEERRLSMIIDKKKNNLIETYASLLHLPEDLVKTLLNNDYSNISSHIIQGLIAEIEETECILFKEKFKDVEIRIRIILEICNELEKYASKKEKYTLCEGLTEQLDKNIIYFDSTKDAVYYTFITSREVIISSTISEDELGISLSTLNEMDPDTRSAIILPILAKRGYVVKSDAESINEIKMLIAQLREKINKMLETPEADTADVDLPTIVAQCEKLLREKKILKWYQEEYIHQHTLFVAKKAAYNDDQIIKITLPSAKK